MRPSAPVTSTVLLISQRSSHTNLHALAVMDSVYLAMQAMQRWSVEAHDKFIQRTARAAFGFARRIADGDERVRDQAAIQFERSAHRIRAEEWRTHPAAVQAERIR